MQLRRRQRRALVASAARMTAANSQYQQRMRQPWQERALGYYDQIGEINFCSKFYARQLSRIRIFPANVDDRGEVTEITDGAPVELLDRVQDPGGGRKRIQFNYGRLMFITGEGLLLVTGEDTEAEQWRFVWNGEVQMVDGVAVRKNGNGALTNEKGTAYRMWTPSPWNSDLADSPLRSVLEIAEQILLLTASSRSTIVSRMVNGLLVIPSEMGLNPPEDGLDEDPELAPFVQRFIDHASAQIENPGSAPASLPLLIEGAYEYLDRIKWIQVHDPANDYMEKDVLDQQIRRLELGLDLPPEALSGLSDANHWQGQQVEWDKWRDHGVPVADQFVADMNQAYLRPALRDENEEWEDVVIGYDDSQVVVSPDQTAVADEAIDRIAIGFEGYRKLKGIPEDYAPTDEEKAFMFGIKTRDPVVAGLEEEAPAVRGPQMAPGVAQEGGQPGTPPLPTGGRVVSRQEARVASIVGAAQMSIRSCRSKAGARLRTMARERKCSDCDNAIDGIPNAMVANALNAATLEFMADRDPIALVKGGTDDFKGCLEEWGVDAENRDVLCERIEAFAAKTLFEPNTPDLPPGFASHVEHALEVSERSLT